jgi:hypothetical protein
LRCRNVGAARSKLRLHCTHVGYRVHEKLDAHLLRKATRELKFKSLLALCPVIKRRRVIECDEAHDAACSYPRNRRSLGRARGHEASCDYYYRHDCSKRKPIHSQVVTYALAIS